MTEYRCPYPHPRIPGQECRGILRLKFSEGKVEIGCPRCHRSRYFMFGKEETVGTALTV